MTACPDEIPRGDAAAFGRRLAATARARRLPLSGTLELTYRCNFDCVHCYEQGARDQNELDGDRWCALVDQIAEAGCLYVTLTGGEALLHADFPRIYEHATRRGLLVTVFSNGSTLTERAVDLFRRLPPRAVEVTLYGFSPEAYARATGRARGFDLARAGLERVRALGVDVCVKTIVFDATAPDFDRVRAYAAAIGARFRYDTHVHAGLEGHTGPLAHRLAADDIVAIERRTPEAYDNIRARLGTAAAAPDDRVYRCSAGRTGFTIAPDGFLQLCSIVRSVRVDLARASFAEAWAALAAETERRYASPHRRCASCELRHMCGSCPGIAELEAGDAEAALDHFCEVTYRRASEILGRPLEPPWKKRRPRSLRVVA
jgi:radical SAM protein with 4Fe4S-binding SPASM domain